MKPIITINKIVEPICPLFDNKDNKIGEVTSSLQMNDVRLQIHRLKLKGYYFVYKDEKIYINKYGGIINQKPGFYDMFDDQLDEFLSGYTHTFD